MTKEAVANVLALIGAALDREISDATVDAWVLVMDVDDELLDDESLKLGAVRLLRTWDTTWLPPPVVVMMQAREAKLDELREQHAALMEGKK